MQATFCGMPLVVARWGLHNEKKERELARAVGVQTISTNLKGARSYIVQLLQLDPEPAVTLDFPRAQEPAAHARLN